MAKRASTGNHAKKFKATLEHGSYGLGWTTVKVPFEPREVWKEMVRLRVCGEVNGVTFRTSLFPVPGGGGLLLLVTNAVQREAGIMVGSVAEFSLEPDMEPRPAELPDELAMLLDEEDGLRAYYDSLSESMRREIGKWINAVKSDASRMKRCEQMAERLLSAIEGEKELPPLVAAAFRRRPKAKAAWAKLTQTQRRRHLLGVFYYQTPEARERRVEKLCDEVEKKA
jgi:uncharacterized protein YdeI (YjbR/CyaY-like superfamily)